MNNLRFLIILMVLWLGCLLVLQFSELSTLVSPSVFLFSFVAALFIFLLPDMKMLQWHTLLGAVFLIYLALNALGLSEHEQVTFPTLVVELAILSSTVFLARLTSAAVANMEQVTENAVGGPSATRILSTSQGEAVTNEELFRARRYSRPVGFLLLKLSDVPELQYSGALRLKYQDSLQRHFLRARVGYLVESMLYHTDPIAWYKEDLVVCLPETNAEESLTLAKQITDMVRDVLNIRIHIGVANFPQDGLIYADLVGAASRKVSPSEAGSEPLQAHLNARILPERSLRGATDTSGAEVLALDYKMGNSLAALELQSKPATGLLMDMAMNALRPVDNLLQTRSLRQPVELPHSDPGFWLNRWPYQSAHARQVYSRIKRLTDLMMVIVTMPLTLPVGIVIVALIYLSDRSTPFYVQRRAGLGGRPFKMYKFRSMILNADRRLEELGVRVNERGETVDEFGNKLANDPRITTIGKILRKTSLDELPQLWNVLRGEMSIVGPRPTSFGVDKYSLIQTHRLSVKPGITGLWQIYDRGDTDFDKRLVWDIKYIDKMCLSLDLRILLYTVLKFTNGAR